MNRPVAAPSQFCGSGTLAARAVPKSSNPKPSWEELLDQRTEPRGPVEAIPMKYKFPSGPPGLKFVELVPSAVWMDSDPSTSLTSVMKKYKALSDVVS